MSQLLGEVAIRAAGGLAEATSTSFSAREKYLTAFASLLAFGAFWFAGSLFHIPTFPHDSASLLQQSTFFTSVVVVAIVFGVAVVVGCIIAGSIGFDSGLFCGCVGLCCLSIRGGPMRYTLFENPSASVWMTLVAELILLCGLVFAGTALQHVLHRFGLLHDDDHRHVVTELHGSIDQRLLALLTGVCVMTVALMLFAATDKKVQVVAAVAISSFLGTLAAYYLVPTKPSCWYWASPIIVGVIGYGIQYFTHPEGWQIGQAGGMFAALARPMPLDYVGAGVAAAIVGYWMSRRWQHEREISTVTGDTPA